jgi:hypothetical protein
MTNNFKATLDDLPEILSGINYQLQRIADALEGEEVKPKPSTRQRIRDILDTLGKEGDDYDF